MDIIQLLLILLFLLLPIIAIIYGISIRVSINNSYQPAKCLITSSGTVDQVISTSSDSNGNTTQDIRYSPVLYYTLTRHDGQQITAQGYDGPVQSTYVFSDEAQRIVNQYQVNHTYACWYSSTVLPHQAVLVFHPYNIWDDLATILGTLLAGAFMAFIALFLVEIAARTYRWRKYGVTVEGRVLRHEQQTVKDRTTTVSVIGFKSAGPPERTFELKVGDALAVGTLQPVSYDLSDIKHTARIGGIPKTSTSFWKWLLVIALFTVEVIMFQLMWRL